MASTDSLEADPTINIGQTHENVTFVPTELPGNIQELGRPRRELTPTLISGQVLSDVLEYLQAGNDRERGGFLVGNFIETGRGRLVNVAHFLPAEFGQRTVGSITLTPDDFSSANRWMQDNCPDLKIVGWVHSHPFWTPAPSSDDVFIMNHFFNLPYHVTMIVNPNTHEVGDFRWIEGQVENTGGVYLDPEGLREGVVIDGITNDVRLDQGLGTQKVTLRSTLPDDEVEKLIVVHPSKTDRGDILRITKDDIDNPGGVLRITKEDIKP